MRNEIVGFNRGLGSPFRLFEEFERDMENIWGRPSKTQFFSPTVDVQDNENGYFLSFDVPGVPKEDVHLEIQDGVLKVWGERKREIEDGKYSEKSYGRFERSFSLPDTSDAENVEANFENGVLTVMIPKKQAVKPRKIEVKEGKGSFFNKLLSSSKKEESKH